MLFVVGAAMAGLDGIQRPPLDALIPRLVDREELPRGERARLASARPRLGGGPGARRRPHRGARPAARRTRSTSRRSASRSWRSRSCARCPRRPVPTGRASGASSRASATRRAARSCVGTYSGRPDRHVLRDADRALPGLRGGVRRRRGARAPLRGAAALGALLATATSGWTGARPPARAGGRLGGGGLGARASTALGFAPNSGLALAALALAGGADMVSGIFRGDDLEHDDPRPPARPPRRDRAGELLGRARSSATSSPASSRASPACAPRSSPAASSVSSASGSPRCSAGLPALRRARAPGEPSRATRAGLRWPSRAAKSPPVDSGHDVRENG